MGISCKLPLGDLTHLEPKRCGHDVGLASYSSLSPAPSGGLWSQFAPTLVWVLSLIFFPSTLCPRHIPTWDLKHMSSDRLVPFEQCSFIQQTFIQPPMCINL